MPDDLDMRRTDLDKLGEMRWIRQTQEIVAPGIVEIRDYESDGVLHREPWWAFWRPKNELWWQQVGPTREESRLEEAVEVWFRNAWDRDFGTAEAGDSGA